VQSFLRSVDKSWEEGVAIRLSTPYPEKSVSVILVPGLVSRFIEPVAPGHLMYWR